MKLIKQKGEIMKNQVLAAFLLFTLLGCATPARRLTQISLGYTKQEIIKELGQPTVARGAIRNKHNQVVEVWEYKLTMPFQESAGSIIAKSAVTFITLGIGAITFVPERRSYWLYFV